MLVSTKGRYALRVMIDLAESGLEEYVPLKEIADREEISRKYLENIMTVLSKAGLVDAIHGKGGGYRLTKSPEEYTLASILHATEGSLAAVVTGGFQPLRDLASVSLTMVSLPVPPWATISRHIRLAL